MKRFGKKKEKKNEFSMPRYVSKRYKIAEEKNLNFRSRKDEIERLNKHN